MPPSFRLRYRDGGLVAALLLNRIEGRSKTLASRKTTVVRYRHRRFGTTIIVTIGIAVVLCFMLAGRLPAVYISLSVGVILLVCAILFLSLSIEITDTRLRWHFGPGMVRKQVLLSDIRDAEVTQTRLIEGWGIHLTSRGGCTTYPGWERWRSN